MRPRIDAASGQGPFAPHLAAEGLRDAEAVADLFLGMFHRDVHAFFPHARYERLFEDQKPALRLGPNFRLVEATDDEEGDLVELYGVVHRIACDDGSRFGDHDLRMVRAIGAVLSLRYDNLFRSHAARLDLYRGGSEDHYVAAFVEPPAYADAAHRPSRIAATLQTLRTAALSTYENHRVSTGALLMARPDDPFHPLPPTPPDALPYGVELTGLKSIHRLCDGEKTLFLVDPEGRLAGIVDIERWARDVPDDATGASLCARDYAAHARATRLGGHVCVVLSPNQEIKVFARGVQAFAFAHGRWRLLNPPAKFLAWNDEIADARLARSLFQAAMNLAEARRGALLVVVDDAEAVVDRLLARSDLISADAPDAPPALLSPRDPLARRALHYLARGKRVAELDPAVLEALASLDGALVVDRRGRILAFGAILRNDAADLTAVAAAEGARTTAAYAASRFGAVLKVSEDGIISCYLRGARAWDL